jgi:hypothetical protein
MGLEQSRAVTLPATIDNDMMMYKEKWNSENTKIIQLNISKKGHSTLPKQILERAANHITTYLQTNNFDTIRILETFAGNGIATNIIYKTLIQKNPNIIIKSTDIQDLSDYIDENSYPVEFGLNSVECIQKYSQDNYNIMMMISPPPNTTSYYADYFAIKEWTNVPTAKLFIFIGELGASDGSEGLYDYMIEDNMDWKLDCRKMLYRGIDNLGGDVEKELFIFTKK